MSTVKERLEKSMGKELTRGWRWSGNVFYNSMYKRVEGTGAWIRFYAGYKRIMAEIETEEEYGIANEEKKFEGENAIGECVSWVAEKLIESSKIITKRVAPYVSGYTSYKRALRGEEQECINT